ncbi:hypothetical protein L3X38_001361 [Prunus dulcis]|uniref:Peptidase S8/S53 domain-containing protein n=1 Tax=Prunus dulcis TaxID=3755 RepID=A0AAD4ZJU6_PRUDU|nr:hypothetical protein L3X38_001361 [Prunus dulcis]
MRALEIGFESSEGNYTVVSGTSFACPHVAGVTALLKSAPPKWSIAAIMTTADIWDNTQEPIRVHKKRSVLMKVLHLLTWEQVTSILTKHLILV